MRFRERLSSFAEFFRPRIELLWHPESPGMRVPVRLTWYRRRPSGFATINDTLRYYSAVELVGAHRSI